MGEQVLSDEQIREAYYQPTAGAQSGAAEEMRALRNIERATIAALAARSGVDVEALAFDAVTLLCTAVEIDACGEPQLIEARSHDAIADALRLALAQQEARHMEREELWRELSAYVSTGHCAAPCQHNYCESIRELRRALGLES